MKWKRVIRLAGLAVAVTTPFWGPVALRPFDFFVVRQVELGGIRYLAPETVTGALALRTGASVWDAVGPLEERVRLLPGVESVSIGRRLPGTLRVQLTEAEPVALAAGAEGLVPVGADGRPLPYDPTSVVVDVPVVERPDRGLVAALAAVRAADPSFYALIASARPRAGSEMELDLEGRGRVRVDLPVDPAVVRAVGAVERDLGARSQAWRELDGRFRGWVVVRRSTRTGASS